MRKIKRYIVALTAVILCAACSQTPSSSEADTMLFTDDYGQNVVVPTHPKRIVSVSPAVTQIMFELGAQDLLVGRTEFCTYPEEAQKIENIGGITNLNVEKVLSLNPDLVISGSMVPQSAVEQVSGMGVPFVCVIEKEKFDGLYDNITRIGELVGKKEAATKLCDSIRQEVAKLSPTDSNNRPTIYYVIGYGKGGNFTAGGNTFIDELISMAGGQNIAHDMEGWEYSLEALMAADPDWIIVREGDREGFCKTKPYSNLTAVKKGRIIEAKSECIDLQVPKNLELIKLINTKITEEK